MNPESGGSGKILKGGFRLEYGINLRNGSFDFI